MDEQRTISSISRNLRAERIRQGLSQRQLAAMAQVSKGAVSTLEADGAKVSGGTVFVLLRLSAALGKPGLDWMLE